MTSIILIYKLYPVLTAQKKTCLICSQQITTNHEKLTPLMSREPSHPGLPGHVAAGVLGLIEILH